MPADPIAISGACVAIITLLITAVNYRRTRQQAQLTLELQKRAQEWQELKDLVECLNLDLASTRAELRATKAELRAAEQKTDELEQALRAAERRIAELEEDNHRLLARIRELEEENSRLKSHQ